MSTVPACPVRIEDLGDRRLITIEGPHFEGSGLRRGRGTLQTFYSRELIEKILKVSGSQWLIDEINREQDPVYVRQQLDNLIIDTTCLRDKTILDFGSGGGASSIHLCRMGAKHVHGVDILEDFVKMANLRVRECGVEDSIIFHYTEDTTHLPFSSEFFDIIVCYAVLEHIPPKKRRSHLQELWRTLKTGGLLFVGGTPNRVFPMDGHTTGLPFVPYLPLKIARLYGILCSKNVGRNDSIDDLLSRGIRGVTYWEIRNAFKNPVYIPHDDLNRYFNRSLSLEKSSWKMKVKIILKHFYRTLNCLYCEPFSVPVAAFFPSLSLCFKKS